MDVFLSLLLHTSAADKQQKMDGCVSIMFYTTQRKTKSQNVNLSPNRDIQTATVSLFTQTQKRHTNTVLKTQKAFVSVMVGHLV